MILLELMIDWASGWVNSRTYRGRPQRRYKPAGRNYVFGQRNFAFANSTSAAQFVQQFRDRSTGSFRYLIFPHVYLVAVVNSPFSSY